MTNSETPKVLKPGDEQYKDDKYFKNERHDTDHYDSNGYRRHYKYGTQIGCGPLGCFSGCLILIFFPIIIIYLLQYLF
ncbi:hypothetical protein MHZ36_12420 [Staphylococcus sp. ACRSN]|uniref:hypothetical protein n=1 Tax=Staphylococcus sp. ACRSN TaxID=2918214 RepID=UPI001EF2B565|nr:hypothetical protein [Staphylococcus sp. ACRSN]MCG7340093.1 hypothetical protein [Staphylococcus sp. ACRSN]